MSFYIKKTSALIIIDNVYVCDSVGRRNINNAHVGET
jgi:hypothetical protein